MSSRQYKTDPIEEALCEFTFESNTEWNLTLPGKLHMEIQGEYYGVPRQINIQTVMTNPPNFGVQSDLRVQLPTPDGSKLVTIGRNSLGVNVLKPYEGWKEFQPRIRRALEAYHKVVAPKCIVRIGVRYINRIIVPEAGARAARYFRFDQTDEEALSATLTGFMRRSEYMSGDKTKLLITHATMISPNPEQTEFLLDLDTYGITPR